MTESAPNTTPHPVEPAEGDVSPGSDESGRTPHPSEPAEGPAEGNEQAAADGVDPESRVTGA